VNGFRNQNAAAAGDAQRISAASGTAVDPSYIDALATSMPVSWQIIVWNSKIVVSVPCEISD
jgi:hypothetical protein